MPEVLNTFFELINGDYPDFFETEYLSTIDVLNKQHFFGFYLYRGQIKSVSPLIMRDQELGSEPLPDRYEYHVEFEDELGSITLHSPILSDERKIYKEMSDAFNDESIVEIMVFVSPFPDIDASGIVKDTTRNIVTLWPVKLRVVSTFAEDAQFTHTNFGYDITFRRDTVSYPDEDGFYYLHKMLSKPGETFTSQELFIARKGFYVPEFDVKQIRDYIINENAKDEEISEYLAKVPKVRRDQILIYNREILKLKKENDSLNPDVDSVRINDNNLEIKLLKEGLFELLDIKDPKGNTASGIIKVTANYVGKAFRRSLDQIEQKQPALHNLIQKRITTGALCKYLDDLDHPISWLT